MSEVYKGHFIWQDRTRYVLRAHWGDQPGENVHRFRTLKLAKAFVDREVHTARERYQPKSN